MNWLEHKKKEAAAANKGKRDVETILIVILYASLSNAFTEKVFGNITSFWCEEYWNE